MAMMSEKKLTFTQLRYRPNDYDPRIGLKVDELPDHNYKYEFNVRWGSEFQRSVPIIPLKPDDRIDAKLHFKHRLDIFTCEPITPQPISPRVLVGKCESFPECQLKLEPLWPSVSVSGYKRMVMEYEVIDVLKTPGVQRW
ncbi:unnamed protein product, partial [Allacma fusca]